jgi:hypothetical protein
MFRGLSRPNTDKLRSTPQLEAPPINWHHKWHLSIWNASNLLITVDALRTASKNKEPCHALAPALEAILWLCHLWNPGSTPVSNAQADDESKCLDQALVFRFLARLVSFVWEPGMRCPRLASHHDQQTTFADTIVVFVLAFLCHTKTSYSYPWEKSAGAEYLGQGWDQSFFLRA